VRRLRRPTIAVLLDATVVRLVLLPALILPRLEV